MVFGGLAWLGGLGFVVGWFGGLGFVEFVVPEIHGIIVLVFVWSGLWFAEVC